LSDLGIDGWIILKWNIKEENGGTERIDLAQDKDMCLNVMKTVMKH